MFSKLNLPSNLTFTLPFILFSSWLELMEEFEKGFKTATFYERFVRACLVVSFLQNCW